MRHRCRNKNDPRYADYGGRGVRVYPPWDRPWNGGFESFLAYMGKCPPDKNSIDRWPDKNGNYEPGNVRWGTDEEQNNNKRTNHLVTYNGKTQTIAQWARETGIWKATICKRLKAGWPLHMVFHPGSFKGQKHLTSHRATPTLPPD